VTLEIALLELAVSLVSIKGNKMAEQANLLGGVFQSPSNIRQQGRNRLIGDVLSVSQSSDPISAAGAMGAADLGLGLGNALGFETQPQRTANIVEQVQRETLEGGFDPSMDPEGTFNFIADRFNQLGAPDLAMQALNQKAQFAAEPQQPPAAFQNLALRARAAGLEPGTREYAEFFRTGGREPDAGTNVTIQGDTGPQVGTIPQGFQLEEVDGSYRLSPIPGGPADLEAQQAEEQAEGREELQQRAGQVVFEDIERLENLVSNDSILDPVLGVKGVVASQIPGTKRVDAESLAQTVRANIGFDRLQQMREASPTGGALGQVSNQELDTLQSVLGSLSFSQSQDQLLQNLDRLKQIYSVILTKAQAYPNANDFGFGESSASAGAAAEGLGNGEGGSPTVDWSDM